MVCTLYLSCFVSRILDRTIFSVDNGAHRYWRYTLIFSKKRGKVYGEALTPYRGMSFKKDTGLWKFGTSKYELCFIVRKRGTPMKRAVLLCPPPKCCSVWSKYEGSATLPIHHACRLTFDRVPIHRTPTYT